MNEHFVCCLCGKSVHGAWGNNPWPLSDDANDRCCDACNATKVIPARLGIIADNRKRQEK